ncbi:MAG: helix-turn-helix domain-containing protein [Methylophilus sp.]|uniref:helix-turn-helix domain-containing protein n=1 Tax=Methylophilus sp. TaxID=29541 RepID=UPI004036DC76
MDLKKALGNVFMKVRKGRGFSQEDFGLISSRTYVSKLERGIASPTLIKLDQLARVMDVHPASIVVQSYLAYDKDTSALELMSRIMEDLKKLEP